MILVVVRNISSPCFLVALPTPAEAPHMQILAHCAIFLSSISAAPVYNVQPSRSSLVLSWRGDLTPCLLGQEVLVA